MLKLDIFKMICGRKPNCLRNVNRKLLFYVILSLLLISNFSSNFKIDILGTVRSTHSLLYQGIAAPKQLTQKYQLMRYDDELLLDQVQKYFLDHPSRENYNLKLNENELDVFGYKLFTTEYSYEWCMKVIKSLFADRPPGFFVEAGALDGEFLSNTLFLEKQLGWKGLLVEANDESYKELLSKHRKSWSSSSCLSTKPHPHKEVLTAYTYTGELLGYRYGANAHSSLFGSTKGNTLDGNSPGVVVYKPVQCFPLATLLAAISVSHVDFISLDVEGAEMGVLRNFPWEKISVDVWLVEHEAPQVDGEEHDKNKLDKSFVDLFHEKGYKLYKVSTEIPSMNYVFVKDSYYINIREG